VSLLFFRCPQRQRGVTPGWLPVCFSSVLRRASVPSKVCHIARCCVELPVGRARCVTPALSSDAFHGGLTFLKPGWSDQLDAVPPLFSADRGRFSVSDLGARCPASAGLIGHVQISSTGLNCRWGGVQGTARGGHRGMSEGLLHETDRGTVAGTVANAHIPEPIGTNPAYLREQKLSEVVFGSVRLLKVRRCECRCP